MRVIITLQDNEGYEHKSAPIELDDQATIEALQKELDLIFHIEPKFQQIFFGEKKIEILSGPLAKILGNGNNYELVLKHSELGNWVAFKSLSAEIKETVSHKAKEIIRRASKHLTKLDRSEFFVAYPRFEETWIHFNKTYAHKLDTNDELMKNAAREYFLGLYKCNPDNPNVAVDFENKPVRGIQGGFICVVTITENYQTKKVKYHVKVHSRVSSRRLGNGNVDLREFFVYKLLEKIKIGPKVYFAPNNHKSRFGIYIVTEDVPGFQMGSKKALNDEQSSKLKLLENILMLVDLRDNKDNFGCDGEGNLIIVDFRVGCSMAKFKSKEFKNDEKYANYLTYWKFPTIFNEVDKEIEVQKKLLEQKGIDRYPSQALKEYIEQIKENCDEIRTNPKKKFKQST